MSSVSILNALFDQSRGKRAGQERRQKTMDKTKEDSMDRGSFCRNSGGDKYLLERLKIALSEYSDIFEAELIEKRKNLQICTHIFDELRKIRGFEGAGFYNREGDLIIAHNLNFSSIREFGFLGLNLYGDTVDGIERFRLGKFESFQIRTDRGFCIFSWLIPENIFLEVIINDEGNLGLFKRNLRKISYLAHSFN